MAKVNSEDGTLEVSTDDVTYNTVGEVYDITQDENNEDVDGTSFDSSGQETDYGEESVGLSVSYRYDESDAGQEAIRDAVKNKTLLYYRHRPRGNTSGARQMKFQGKATLSTPRARNEKVNQTATITSHGGITRDTV